MNMNMKMNMNIKDASGVSFVGVEAFVYINEVLWRDRCGCGGLTCLVPSPGGVCNITNDCDYTPLTAQDACEAGACLQQCYTWPFMGTDEMPPHHGKPLLSRAAPAGPPQGQKRKPNKEGSWSTKERKWYLRERLLQPSPQLRENLPLFGSHQDVYQQLTRDIAGGGFIKRNSQGNRSRKLSLEPNLSTPIDNGGENEVSDSLHSTSTSLLHQDVPLASKTTGLVVSTDWITDVADLVVQDLNQFGICVVDDFLGSQQAEKIFDNVSNLYNKGVFRDGEVVSQSIPAQDREKIRGDKITWVSGSESTCLNIGQLVAVLDAIISTASKHANADKIADYNIKTRTRAMVACYPGSDAHYVKHVDNPNNDGRCITAIYYLNKDWQKENGGVLRVYPEDSLHQVAEIEPLFDRMLFFWSDRRNPHEVLPAKMTRYAATVWYLNQDEREAYLSRRRER